eukprot:m.68504 g.68504  ORF g.68504 m.68504 type:complete len:135 (-) comp15990_c0_seq1:890-1294(-)
MAAKASNQEIEAQFQRMLAERQQMLVKLNEVEGDLQEHGLVTECLSKCKKDRKCWRMIGGVLVERTVEDVLPAIDGNKNQIAQLVTMLKRQLDDKTKKIDAFRAKHSIQSQQQQGSGRADNDGGDAKTSSILVD